MKRCSKCKEELSLDNFAKNKAMQDGLQHYCRNCSGIAAKKYRDSHRTKVLQIYKDYHEVHKEESTVQYKKWYKKNKNKKIQYCRQYYKDNVEYMKKKAKKWEKENPQQKIIHVQNRRAMLLNAPGKFTKEDYDIKYLEQEGKCFYCSKFLEKLTIDHKIPLSRGGSNWPDNIVLACLSCNCRKNNKTDEEFLQILTKEMSS